MRANIEVNIIATIIISIVLTKGTVQTFTPNPRKVNSKYITINI